MCKCRGWQAAREPRRNPFNFCGVFLHVLLLYLYGLGGGGVNC